jgi:DNA-directed RNA polymerase subunit M/transcription elongation factor TFIIS
MALMCVYEATCKQRIQKQLPYEFFAELEVLLREDADQLVFAIRLAQCFHAMPTVLTDESSKSPTAAFEAVVLHYNSNDKISKYTDTDIEEGFITCKCGSKKVKWTEKHTRSADEGSTVFMHCTVCGKQWKMSA